MTVFILTDSDKNIYKIFSKLEKAQIAAKEAAAFSIEATKNFFEFKANLAKEKKVKDFFISQDYIKWREEKTQLWHSQFDPRKISKIPLYDKEFHIIEITIED